MRKIMMLFIVMLFVTSCSFIEDRSFDSQEGIKNIEKILIKSFSGKKLYQLSIGAKDELSKDFGNASIEYLENGETYWLIWDHISKLRKPTDARTKFDEDKFTLIEISELNITKIPNQVNQAITMIKDKYNGYDEFNMHQYKFYVTPKGVEKSFTINATGNATSTSLQGKNIVMEYQNFSFKVKENGELEMLIRK